MAPSPADRWSAADQRTPRRDVLAEVAEWLASPEATRVAKRRLAERRIGVPAQEVLDTALTNIWQRVRRAGGTMEIDDVARYCAIVIRNVVNNLARGFEADDGAFDDQDLERRDAPIEIVATADPVGGRTRDEGIRAALEAIPAPATWVLSAALSFVTLSEYPELVVAEAPRPQAGARPDQARMWPCLWMAGVRDGVFPDGGAHHAAQRQRLSRAAARVRELVERAAEYVWTDRGGR